MSKAPAMPMYWDAYIADTTHLSTEEHGAYLLLLGAMWRRDGSVPDDDRDNARILGLTVAKWRKVKVRLDRFLIVENGMITQKNLRKIWENTQEKIEKNRSNGALGGRPQSNKNKDLVKANGFVSLNPNETIPEPEPYLPIEDKSSIDEAVVDPAKLMFDYGVKLLIEAGKTEGSARAILGKWKKQHGEATVIAALGKAQREGAIDPVAFCEGVFRHSKKHATASPQMAGAFGRIPERN